MQRILVLRGGALGDFLVTLPALALLRRRWPTAAIELVGNVSAAHLALARGWLAAVHSQHERRWAAFYGADPLPAELRAWLDSFDLVINFWPDPEGELGRRFPTRPGQRFLQAPALPGRGPAAAHYCAPLAELGLEPGDYHQPLAPLLPVAVPAERLIVIHPGSGSPRKNWPRENWLELIRQLPAPVALVLGEAELRSWHGIELAGVSRLEARPLEELVTHFSHCRLFLGHDSGVSHLAAACGAPCVLLFGPTDPAVWAPPSPRVKVIGPVGDLNSLAVSGVRQAVAAALADPG
jgi:heptosyltransferase-3